MVKEAAGRARRAFRQHGSDGGKNVRPGMSDNYSSNLRVEATYRGKFGWGVSRAVGLSVVDPSCKKPKSKAEDAEDTTHHCVWRNNDRD